MAAWPELILLVLHFGDVFRKENVLRLYDFLVWSMHAIFQVLPSECAAGRECFLPNKGERWLANQRGIQQCSEPLLREKHWH